MATDGAAPPDGPRKLSPATAIQPGSLERRGFARVRVALASAGAALLGAAPHVLHHAGPLAGAAIVSGAAGTALFGALGLLLALPLLWRLRQRTGSWRLPLLALAAMAAAFTVSTLLVGPALRGNDAEGRREVPSTPAPGSREHEEHHP